jgi:hypothetical protein
MMGLPSGGPSDGELAKKGGSETAMAVARAQDVRYVWRSVDRGERFAQLVSTAVTW